MLSQIMLWFISFLFSGPPPPQREREFFIDKLLVQIHHIIVMIRRAGFAPWEFEFPGSLTSTFPLSSHRCPSRPDFRVKFGDFWRVFRERINSGQILKVTGACKVVATNECEHLPRRGTCPLQGRSRAACTRAEGGFGFSGQGGRCKSVRGCSLRLEQPCKRDVTLVGGGACRQPVMRSCLSTRASLPTALTVCDRERQECHEPAVFGAVPNIHC